MDDYERTPEDAARERRELERRIRRYQDREARRAHLLEMATWEAEAYDFDLAREEGRELGLAGPSLMQYARERVDDLREARQERIHYRWAELLESQP